MTSDDYPPQLGTVVDGRYLLEDQLGIGGYGCVMRARDQLTRQLVAVKFFDLSDADADARRFAREVQAMQSVSHRYVVWVIASNMQHMPPSFVMPIADATLEKWAETHGRNELVLRRLIQVCEGLQALHSAGLVHRDVKPTNMLVFGGNTVISDLGLARTLVADGSRLTRSTTVLGTEEYLAPEQRVRGGSHKADVRTDVYMLGRSLYELLTGKSPVVMTEDSVDAGVWPIILKATAEDPGRRYQSVAEFADALKSYARTLDPALHPDVRLRAEIQLAEQVLQSNQYRVENVLEIMRLWLRVEAPILALQIWDEIPGRLMQPMAEADSSLLEHCARRLRKVFQTALAERGWSYAETVAKRMKAIFSGTKSPTLKTESLRLTLVAAVHMNRFAAMDVFDAMLMSSHDPPTAAAIAEMLREERDSYKQLADRLQADQLAIPIRAVRESILAPS